MRTTRDPLNPQISLWRMLAYQLQWEREKHGLSLAQWGKIASAAPSTVCNIEAGRRKIDERQAKILDHRFQTGRRFELLLWYARKGHTPDWAQSMTAYEAMALVTRIYQGQVIPPPFQTQEYARALVRARSIANDPEETLEAADGAAGRDLGPAGSAARLAAPRRERPGRLRRRCGGHAGSAPSPARPHGTAAPLRSDHSAIRRRAYR